MNSALTLSDKYEPWQSLHMRARARTHTHTHTHTHTFLSFLTRVSTLSLLLASPSLFLQRQKSSFVLFLITLTPLLTSERSLFGEVASLIGAKLDNHLSVPTVNPHYKNRLFTYQSLWLTEQCVNQLHHVFDSLSSYRRLPRLFDWKLCHNPF